MTRQYNTIFYNTVKKIQKIQIHLHTNTFIRIRTKFVVIFYSFPIFYFFSHAAMFAAIFGFSSVNLLTHQAVKFDFTAVLTGTGNRSEELKK